MEYQTLHDQACQWQGELLAERDRLLRRHAAKRHVCLIRFGLLSALIFATVQIRLVTEQMLDQCEMDQGDNPCPS